MRPRIPSIENPFGTANGSSSRSRTAATCTSTPSRPTARQPPELIVGGEQAITAFDIRDGKLAYVATTHTTLRELYVGTDDRRVTHVGTDFETGRALADAERFTAVSADGYEVDAWIVRPRRLRSRASATPRS